jgi:hypothetical protein
MRHGVGQDSLHTISLILCFNAPKTTVIFATYQSGNNFANFRMYGHTKLFVFVGFLTAHQHKKVISPKSRHKSTHGY